LNREVKQVPTQAQGFLGRQVEGMIRRSLRSRFHSVRWEPPTNLPAGPRIYVPNHHGWHDGYVMYAALTKLNHGRFYDWIQEYKAFPLFGRVGGMNFPPDDANERAKTIRQTIRLLREGDASLLLFAEQHLHRPPELREFGRTLELIARQVPSASIIPVAIRYELCYHERPEAYVCFGPAVEPGPDVSRRTRNAVRGQMDRLRTIIEYEPERLETLVAGTKDVNERLDIRRFHPSRWWATKS